MEDRSMLEARVMIVFQTLLSSHATKIVLQGTVFSITQIGSRAEETLLRIVRHVFKTFYVFSTSSEQPSGGEVPALRIHRSSSVSLSSFKSSTMSLPRSAVCNHASL